MFAQILLRMQRPGESISDSMHITGINTAIKRTGTDRVQEFLPLRRKDAEFYDLTTPRLCVSCG
jgi:hypothetical protein